MRESHISLKIVKKLIKVVFNQYFKQRSGILGILITSYNQAELFIPSTNSTFPLPAIPSEPRVWHTLTGNVVCGGAYPDTSSSCLELKENGEGWGPYSTRLQQPRLAHSSWDSPEGSLSQNSFTKNIEGIFLRAWFCWEATTAATPVSWSPTPLPTPSST